MMAKTTIVTDDLDGTSAAETVTFAYDGVSYSIDLSKKNRTALAKALKPYLSAATRVGRTGSRRSGSTGRQSGRRRSGPALSDVRAWATEQGMTVSERVASPGRVRRVQRSTLVSIARSRSDPNCALG